MADRIRRASPFGPPKPRTKRTDPRYRRAKWTRVTRPSILRRDGWRCRVDPSCDLPATCVDHIRPVYEGMPDAEFYDPANLRAACEPHNHFRAAVARVKATSKPLSASTVTLRGNPRAKLKVF